MFTNNHQQNETERRAANCRRIYLASRKINRLRIKEKNKKKLLSQTCNILTLTRGYSGVWIVLFEDHNRMTVSAESGISSKFPHALLQMNALDFTGLICNTLGRENVLDVDLKIRKVLRACLQSLNQVIIQASVIIAQ